jgi:hypothetical protein
MLPLAITACGSDRFLTKTEVVVVRTDPALTARVAAEDVRVVVNEDLDRRADRLAAALKECNARLEDVERAQEQGVEQATQLVRNDQSAAPWWRRIFGGAK